jgi:NAD(P)H-binding
LRDQEQIGSCCLIDGKDLEAIEVASQVTIRHKPKRGGSHASVHGACRGGATGRVGSRVVELLEASGHDVVPMSRSTGVDVITGEGLAEALAGVECVIDVASGSAASPAGSPRPRPQAASEFFTASARNLHETGQKAGVQRMVEVSIIGIDPIHRRLRRGEVRP